ncbi:MAG: LytTR family DNA-binding domain-containing protein [Bacteroidota bacterium]
MTLSYLIARLAELNQPDENILVTFLSENQKDQFQLKPENLLFVKSADNYVEIYYHDTKQSGKRLLRNALQKLEEEFRHENFLIRCHRSYLVNPANIDHIDNSPGKVELNVKGEVIPVSKKYANNFIADH